MRKPLRGWLSSFRKVSARNPRRLVQVELLNHLCFRRQLPSRSLTFLPWREAGDSARMKDMSRIIPILQLLSPASRAQMGCLSLPGACDPGFTLTPDSQVKMKPGVHDEC